MSPSLPDPVLCHFPGSREARAPGCWLPALTRTSPRSAPAASPVVLPPAKPLLFVSLAGGIASHSAKLLLSGGPGSGFAFFFLICFVFFRSDVELSVLEGQFLGTADGAGLQKEGVWGASIIQAL